MKSNDCLLRLVLFSIISVILGGKKKGVWYLISILQENLKSWKVRKLAYGHAAGKGQNSKFILLPLHHTVPLCLKIPSKNV